MKKRFVKIADRSKFVMACWYNAEAHEAQH